MQTEPANDDHPAPPAAGHFGEDCEYRRAPRDPIPDIESFEDRFVISESGLKRAGKGTDGLGLVA